MKRLVKYTLYATLFFVFFTISSCSKDDSNPVGATVVVKVSATLYSNYANHTPHPTIIKADLSIDNDIIASVNFAQAVASAKLEGTKNSVKEGEHTILFKLTDASGIRYDDEYIIGPIDLTVGNTTYWHQSVDMSFGSLPMYVKLSFSIPYDDINKYGWNK